MKRLIVNADDLGADEARNRGIFEAIDAGVVTSVSLLANGPSFEDAARRIRNLDPTYLLDCISTCPGVPVAARIEAVDRIRRTLSWKKRGAAALTQQQAPTRGRDTTGTVGPDHGFQGQRNKRTTSTDINTFTSFRQLRGR